MPRAPGEGIEAAFFQCQGKSYLVLYNVFSQFPFLWAVPTLSASALMAACRAFFQFAGCPREFWCDQGGAFDSDSFRAFAEALGIKICYTSAEYPQSNGAAKSVVKILKRLRAAAATDFDLFRAILYLQNTVKRAKSASPAQIFLGRAVRTPLHEGDVSQHPALWKSHFEERIADQRHMKIGYDTVGMREHVTMCVGDPVLVHNVRGKLHLGTVVQQLPTP
jgi:transposase InsO family protein